MFFRPQMGRIKDRCVLSNGCFPNMVIVFVLKSRKAFTKDFETPFASKCFKHTKKYRSPNVHDIQKHQKCSKCKEKCMNYHLKCRILPSTKDIQRPAFNTRSERGQHTSQHLHRTSRCSSNSCAYLSRSKETCSSS